MTTVENIQNTILVPTNDESCWNIVPTTKRTKDNSEEEKTKNIKSLELVNTWINSENNEFLWDSKYKLFTMMNKKLKKDQYTNVYNVTDFVRYLSEESRGYFRMVVNHVDKFTKKIVTMYDWNSGVFNKKTGKRGHCYIVAIGDIPVEGYDWAISNQSKYKSIFDKNSDPENPGKITKKGFSILRRHATQDLVSTFMKLNFFEDYELAKSFLIHNTNGYVIFISKEHKESV